MARISIDNGQSTVDVGSLDYIQPSQARKVGETNHADLAREVTVQNHVNTFSWIVSFCDMFEQRTGSVFVAW